MANIMTVRIHVLKMLKKHGGTKRKKKKNEKNDPNIFNKKIRVIRQNVICLCFEYILMMKNKEPRLNIGPQCTLCTSYSENPFLFLNIFERCFLGLLPHLYLCCHSVELLPSFLIHQIFYFVSFYN